VLQRYLSNLSHVGLPLTTSRDIAKWPLSTELRRASVAGGESTRRNFSMPQGPHRALRAKRRGIRSAYGRERLVKFLKLRAYIEGSVAGES
jgi:hypothetical protein